MFRCGGTRKTFCGQVREHIVDFRDTKDTGYIIVMPRTGRWGMPYHVGIRMETCRYDQITLALKGFLF